MNEAKKNVENYLEPVDSLARSRSYEITYPSEKLKKTDNRPLAENLTTPDLDKTSSGTVQDTNDNSSSMNPGETLETPSSSMENAKSLSIDNDHRPVASPRKSLPSSTSTEFDNDNDIRLPDIPSDRSDVKNSFRPSNTSLQKLDSFDKVFDELGDVIFSSDSDDADDEAETDGDNLTPSVHANKREDHKNNCNSGSKEDLGKVDSDDTSSKTDASNPVYFSLNTIQSSDRNSQNDIIPLTGDIKDSEKDITVMPPVPKPRIYSNISISINSPTSPGNSIVADSGHPLPLKYGGDNLGDNGDDDGDGYSDLSDEFQSENTYESLLPRNLDTADTIVSVSQNGLKGKGSSHEPNNEQNNNDSLKSNGPEYFVVEYQDEKRLDNPTTIEEEFYEPLDTVEENLYEELDVFAKKPGNDSSDSTKVIDACSFEHGKEDDVEFVIDTFYLKKLDSIVQEMRFGIGMVISSYFFNFSSPSIFQPF